MADRKRRSLVITSGRIPPRGRPRIWAYGYADLAVLFEMTERAVRQAVHRGRVVPGDLASVLAFLAHRQARAARRRR